MTNLEKPSCSFCGKSIDDVRRLMAGPDCYICDECVSLCTDIVAEGGASPAAKNEWAVASSFCSFCRKSVREVRSLIDGLAGNICDDCVSVCAEVLEEDCDTVAETANEDDSFPGAIENSPSKPSDSWVSVQRHIVLPEPYWHLGLQILGRVARVIQDHVPEHEVRAAILMQQSSLELSLATIPKHVGRIETLLSDIGRAMQGLCSYERCAGGPDAAARLRSQIEASCLEARFIASRGEGPTADPHVTNDRASGILDGIAWVLRGELKENAGATRPAIPAKRILG